jgi:hypothetical protein
VQEGYVPLSLVLKKQAAFKTEAARLSFCITLTHALRRLFNKGLFFGKLSPECFLADLSSGNLLIKVVPYLATAETAKKPVRSITAEISILALMLSLLLSTPPANPPRQKNIIEMVKVSESCDMLQSGKSSPKGVLNMDHAYISPRKRSVTVPMPRYIHLLSDLMLSLRSSCRP